MLYSVYWFSTHTHFYPCGVVMAKSKKVTKVTHKVVKKTKESAKQQAKAKAQKQRQDKKAASDNAKALMSNVSMLCPWTTHRHSDICGSASAPHTRHSRMLTVVNGFSTYVSQRSAA